MTPQHSALTFEGLVAAIGNAHAMLARQATKAVNISLTLRNWFIGFYIAEFEQLLELTDPLKRRFYEIEALRGNWSVRELRRQIDSQYFELIELKNDAFKHEHLGQLNSYVSYYKANQMQDSDQPPIGILLCTRKNHELVEYALAGMSNNIFVSRYQMELPGKEESVAFLHRAVEELEGIGPKVPRP